MPIRTPIAVIRRRRLRLVVDAVGGGNLRRFADLVDIAESSVSAMLNGHKSFGEKIARRIESKLALPDRYLDRDESIAEADLAIDPLECALIALYRRAGAEGQEIILAMAQRISRALPAK